MPTRIATALARGPAEEAATSLCDAVRAQLDGRAPVLVAAFASTSQPLDEVFAELAGQSSVALAFPEGG